MIIARKKVLKKKKNNNTTIPVASQQKDLTNDSLKVTKKVIEFNDANIKPDGDDDDDDNDDFVHENDINLENENDDKVSKINESNVLTSTSSNDLTSNDKENEEMKNVDIIDLSWSDLNIEPWLQSHLLKLNMKIPTVIQEQCIPPTLEGKNVIGMAQTGTGKTAAFALPIIQQLAKDIFGIFALVITPTRELAQQIKMNFELLCADVPLRVALITGGQSFLDLAEMLDSKPHIVVGTPGMIEGAMRRFNNDNYFKKIKYLVFDEADQLLKSDFSLDIDIILRACNPSRQTLLYSATMDHHVKKLAQLSMKKYHSDSIFIYDACRLYTTADNLKQYYLFIPEVVKDCYLLELMNKFKSEGKKTICIIFFSDLEKCETCSKTFRLLGINCDALHSGKPQSERFKVLEDFKHRKLQALFCTDVANRGLDIPSVSYVINYDLPPKTTTYVHRVGRTARAGQTGICISLVGPSDVKRVLTIEKDVGVKMEEYKKIVAEDAEKHMYAIAEKRVQAKLQMLESGFVETFSQVKENRAKSRESQLTARVLYEQQSLDQLKSSTNKLKRFRKNVVTQSSSNEDQNTAKTTNNTNNDDDSINTTTTTTTTTTVTTTTGTSTTNNLSNSTSNIKRNSNPATTNNLSVEGVTILGKKSKRKKTHTSDQETKKQRKN